MLSKRSQLSVLLITEFLLIASLTMSQPYWPLIIGSNATINKSAAVYWSGLVYIVPLVMAMISAPIWGGLADRVGYKKMVLRAACGLAITQGLLILSIDPIYIIFCRFLQGTFCGFIATAQALGTRLVDKDNQTLVIAKLQSATALGTMLGPVVGGVIIYHYPYRAMFVVASIICSLCFIALSLWIKEPSHKKLDTLSKQLKNKIKIAPEARKICLSIFIAQASRMMLMPIFAYFVTENLMLDKSFVGILYAASGVSLFLFSPIIGQYQSKRIADNLSAYLLIAILLLISGIIQFSIAISSNVVSIFILSMLWGGCLAGIMPSLFSLMVLANHSAIKGKVIGYANSASKFGNLCGIAIGTIAMPIIGVRDTIVLSGFLYLLNSVLTTIYYRQFNYKKNSEVSYDASS